MRSSISLGRVFGIPVGVSYTWFIIFLFVSYVVFGQLSLQLPRWNFVTLVGMSAVTGLLFFGSVLAHELAHSLMATRHSLPVRGITLFLLGGVSHISREARRPWSEFIIAFVGPLISLIIGCVMLAIAFVVAPIFFTGPIREGITVTALLLGWTNVALGVFNLLPGFPLDGGRVLRAGIWGLTGNYWLATTVAIVCGQVFAALLTVGSIVLFLRTGSIINLWPILVSAFIFMAASSARAAVRDRRRLANVTVGEAATQDVVPGEATVDDVFSRPGAPGERTVVLVSSFGVPVGVLHLRALRRIPRNAWHIVTARQAMLPMDLFPTLDAGQPAFEALDLFEEDDAPPVVLATQDGDVVGALTRASLYLTMRPRQALNR